MNTPFLNALWRSTDYIFALLIISTHSPCALVHNGGVNASKRRVTPVCVIRRTKHKFNKYCSLCSSQHYTLGRFATISACIDVPPIVYSQYSNSSTQPNGGEIVRTCAHSERLHQVVASTSRDHWFQTNTHTRTHSHTIVCSRSVTSNRWWGYVLASIHAVSRAHSHTHVYRGTCTASIACWYHPISPIHPNRSCSTPPPHFHIDRCRRVPLTSHESRTSV